jgi:hypothetical protein
MSAMCSFTFSVYETVPFVFGIKAKPHIRNTFFESDSFDQFILYVDSCESTNHNDYSHRENIPKRGHAKT